MRKSIIRLLFISIIAILFSSCAAYHSGFLSDSASLSSGNFSYVKQNIKGESTAKYIFGIGGLRKETLVDQAKLDMLASNHSLQDNQALVNLSVNFKSAFYFGIIYHTVTCTVTADIVEFKPSQP